MSPINRRSFLAMAGGATAMATLSPSIARAASIPADRRTGTINDIEHIVVLMQENRSFDHYFGSLRGVRGFGDRTPVTLPDGKPVWNQDGVLPFRPDADNLGLQFIQDLPHGWNDGHAAFDGGKYDEWVEAKSSTTMAYLTREDIPFHYALADAFTVCDAYHCSLLGPTDPNRYYMWTGYVGNDGKGGGPVVTNDELGYDWSTYPEKLEAAGVSWKIYQDQGEGLDAAGSWGWTGDNPYIGNYGDNSLLYFDNYRNAAPGSPLYEKARTGTNALAGEGFFGPLKADVVSGKLPQISYIVAPEAYTEHPNWPANYGAWYVAQVLDALTADPKVWARTALFITYDENDGFFDHMVPGYPTAGQSTVSTANEFLDETGFTQGPYGLGVRVPMIVVSPWSTGGFVCSEVFDHTSIIRFMEKRFGVHEPNISAWRRAVSGDLTAAFDFGKTRTAAPKLPATDGYAPPDRNRHPDYVPTPPADPKLPIQESGRRPARPIPYDLAAEGKYSGNELRITFASKGSIGAVFYVTQAGGDPQTFTAGPRTHLTGSFPATADLTVHGPNGFLRHFKGAGVDATIRGDRLTLANSSHKPARVLVADAYSHTRTVVRLNPGQSQVHKVPLRDGWYDVSLTSDLDHNYARRLVGHLENGEPSLSQP